VRRPAKSKQLQPPRQIHAHFDITMSSVVISSQELERIRRSTTREIKTSPSDLKQERVGLQRVSQDRVKKWPNTLEAERKKKEARRQEKLDREEEERKKIDREEAAIAGEKRRMAIERANKMLYDDSDRVKSFHSNLLLSDVLKEREAQIEVSRQKKKNERRREKHWSEMQREAITEYDKKEIEKREEEKRRKHEISTAREKQLTEIRELMAARKEEEKREGELVVQKAQMEIAKARREEQGRVADAQRRVAENENVNVLLKKLKQEELERELMEEEKLHAIAMEKEAKLIERKRREAENKRLKDEEKQRILDYVTELQLAEMADEEARVENQVAEKAAADKAEALRREERRRREEEEIRRSRAEQLRRKQLQRGKEEGEAREWAAQWSVAKERLQKDDSDERSRIRQRNIDVTNFNIQLREEKKMDRQMGRQIELEASRRSKQIMDEEDLRFEQYTDACMNEWHTQGKSCKPMRITLGKKHSMAD